MDQRSNPLMDISSVYGLQPTCPMCNARNRNSISQTTTPMQQNTNSQMQQSTATPMQQDTIQTTESGPTMSELQAQTLPNMARIPRQNGIGYNQAVRDASMVSSMSPSVGSSIPYEQSISVTNENLQYLNGFLRTQIGRHVNIEFLTGNNMVEKSGMLVAVGINYILLNEIGSTNIISCDFLDVKFITFFNE